MTVNLTRYALWYLGGLVGIVVIALLLQALANLKLPGGVSAIVPPILAAMVEGQRIARARGTPLPGDELVRSAMRMTGVVAAINIVILGLFLMLPPVAQMLGAAPLWILVGLFAALLAVVGLVNWFFLRQSIANELKRMSKSGR